METNMRKLIVVFMLLFASPAFATTWCMWSGTEGENCASDSRGYVRMPDGLLISIDLECLTNNGYYELIETQPTIGEDQVRDVEVWGFADGQISKTWTVRDLTAEEIDNRIASPMSVTNYYIWKALIATGTITIEQAQNNLPQELIDAYQARKRLLGD
jgi:hypothetical protein